MNSDLNQLIEKWMNSDLTLRDVDRLISMLVLENKSLSTTKPENTIGATHWAVLPDGHVIYYKISDKVLLWRPYAEVWDIVFGVVPYTLHSYCSEE